MKNSGFMRMLPLLAFFMLLSVVQTHSKEEAASKQEGTVEISAGQEKQDACTPMWAEELSIMVLTPDGNPAEGLRVLFNPNTESREGRDWVQEMEGFTDQEGVCTFSFGEDRLMLLPKDRAYVMLTDPQNRQKPSMEGMVEIPYSSQPEISLIWTEEPAASAPESGKA